MSSLEFDYSIEFIVDYDAAVIDNSTLPDKDSVEFKAAVIAKVNQINLVKTLQAGILNMASYVDYNGSRYKILVLDN